MNGKNGEGTKKGKSKQKEVEFDYNELYASVYVRDVKGFRVQDKETGRGCEFFTRNVV